MNDRDRGEADGRSDDRWDHQRILAEIRRRGSTISQLSRDHGLSRGTLQQVFYRRYPKGQAIVAAAVERSRHELWPHWYGPDDRPLPLTGPATAKVAA